MWQTSRIDAFWTRIQLTSNDEGAMNHWKDIEKNEVTFYVWKDRTRSIQVMLNLRLIPGNFWNFLPFYITFHFLFNKLNYSFFYFHFYFKWEQKEQAAVYLDWICIQPSYIPQITFANYHFIQLITIYKN